MAHLQLSAHGSTRLRLEHFGGQDVALELHVYSRSAVPTIDVVMAARQSHVRIVAVGDEDTFGVEQTVEPDGSVRLSLLGELDHVGV